MVRLSTLGVAAALALVATGCAGENILKERPAARAAKSTVTRPTLSSGAAGQSTVCAAHRRQLVLVRTRRALRPADAALKQQELSLNALIADACE